MATNAYKSNAITNRDATPKVLSDPYVSAGDIKEVTGYIQTSTTDGTGSTYRMVQVPSNARVTALDFQCQSLGSGCTLDIGVWWPTFIPVGAGLSAANQSLVINTTLYASALSCSAQTAATNLVTLANISILNQEKALWDAAGLTSDPGIELDVVARVLGAVATQGYVGIKAKYVL